MPTSLDYLVFTQHSSGGWGYNLDSLPTVEPTAIALLAIGDDPRYKPTILKGVDWLLRCQHKDGGWGINQDDPESGWQTTWALITLLKFSQSPEVVSRAVDWLVHEATNQVSEDDFRGANVPQSDDPGALVWPWMPGQVCWIEPTAMAILALEGNNQSPLAKNRINAGIEFFRHNRTPSGGWDMGNAGPLDTEVIPRAYPTALALMALAGIAPDKIIPDDVSALQSDMQIDSSILIRSAGLLALRLLGEDQGGYPTYLQQIQLANGSWENHPYFTAWATIGLRGYL